jgi:drug/metabolite transporter (DMT)-like permease
LVLTAIFWGGTFISARMLAGNIPPFSAAFFRFLFASVCLYAIVIRQHGNLALPRRSQVLPVLLLGMTGVFAYNFFFFNGLKWISAGRASVIIANNPIVISTIAAILFKEHLSLGKVVGILTSFSGAAIAISGGNPVDLFSGGVGMGDLMIVGCVASWSAYSLLGKWVMNDMPALLAVAHASAVGMLFLLIPAWIEGMPGAIGSYTVADWGNFAYLGCFGTVLGFVWYYQGIQAIGPSRASLFINFVPICAILMAHGFLGEPLTMSLVIGAGLVIAGVSLVSLQK